MQKKVEKAVQLLASETHEWIRSKAQTELKSRKEAYLNALLPPEPIETGIWAITLQKSGLWIEEGKPAGNLIEEMLKSPKAKQGKNGKYMIIPFEHANSGLNIKSSNSLTTVLQSRAKAEMKDRGIPMKKISRNANGAPIIGLVDTIKNPSKKTQDMLDYMEKNKFFYKKTNSPANISHHLDNLKITQSEVKDKEGNTMMDKHGVARMNKSAKTFRIISESQKGTGLWDVPALAPKNFFDQAYEWAEHEWRNGY